MKLIEFYHKGKLLGGYSEDGTEYRDFVHMMAELSDDYDVPKEEIEVREVEI